MDLQSDSKLEDGPGLPGPSQRPPTPEGGIMILRQEGDGDDRHQPPPLQGNRPGGCQPEWESDATQWQQRGCYARPGPEGAAGLRVRVAAAVAASQGPGRGRPVALLAAPKRPTPGGGVRSGPVGAVWAPAHWHFGVLES